MARPLLLGVAGEPVPRPSILRMCREVHPRLGVVWVRAIAKFALTWAWLPDDPRHQYRHDGKLLNDCTYDILTFLPVDCDVDAAADYARRALQAGGTQADVRAAAAKVEAFNARRQREIEDAAFADVDNRIEVSHLSLRGHFGEDRAPMGQLRTGTRSFART